MVVESFASIFNWTIRSFLAIAPGTNKFTRPSRSTRFDHMGTLGEFNGLNKTASMSEGHQLILRIPNFHCAGGKSCSSTCKQPGFNLTWSRTWSLVWMISINSSAVTANPDKIPDWLSLWVTILDGSSRYDKACSNVSVWCPLLFNFSFDATAYSARNSLSSSPNVANRFVSSVRVSLHRSDVNLGKRGVVSCSVHVPSKSTTSQPIFWDPTLVGNECAALIFTVEYIAAIRDLVKKE